VIVVEDAETIESLGERSRDEILAGLETYLQSPAPFTILLLQASAFDMRLRFSKVLAEKALLVRLSIGDASAAMLAAEIAKELGAEIDREAAALLADILNGEPARMRIELEKLAVYVQGRGRIVAGDVEALVVAARKNTVWQLADLLATRRRNDALAFLDNLLREGEQPVGLVGALAWMYRKLIEARELPPHTPGWQAAGQLNMRPDGAEVAMRNAHKIPRAELLEGIAALADADSELKSGTPNPRAVLEFLLARLMGARTPA
jgi:DNA polymerase-3 subunit delta